LLARTNTDERGAGFVPAESSMQGNPPSVPMQGHRLRR
jgi:hypothetical protein